MLSGIPEFLLIRDDPIEDLGVESIPSILTMEIDSKNCFWLESSLKYFLDSK